MVEPGQPAPGGHGPYRGVSYLLEGDAERADPILASAVDVAVASGAVPFVALVLAERAIAASERGEWSSAQGFTQEALSIVRDGHFEEYWTSALVYAWAARTAARRGEVVEARQHVVQAARLRPLLTHVLPVVSAQALLELGRAYLALGDAGGARAVLRQVQDIFQRRPALGVLPAQAAELRARLGAITTPGTGGRRRSPPPSYASCRCWPPISAWERSASVSTSPGTP